MTTFIAKKQLVFQQAGDQNGVLCRERSNYRLEDYGSKTDVRSWRSCDEDRRLYFLDLVRQPLQKINSFRSKLIPIEIVIDFLFVRKNAHILRLNEQLYEMRQLLGIYQSLHLTESQNRELALMVSRMSVNDLEIEDELTVEEECVTIVGFTKSCTSVKKQVEDKSVNIIDSEKEDLRITLERKEKELQVKKQWAHDAMKQLNSLKAIMVERDEYKNQLIHAKLKIETLQSEKDQLAKSVKALSKPKTLVNLESDLSEMKSNAVPGQELDLIHKELEVLRCYCDKLSEIHQENQELKREIEYFKKLLKGKHEPLSETDIKKFYEYESKKAEMDSHIKKLENETKNLRNENTNLNKQLEKLVAEKADLYKTVNKVKDLESKLKGVKVRADEANRYEREVKNLKNKINDMEIIKKKSQYQEEEIRNLKEEIDVCNRIITNTRCECEGYKDKLTEMHRYVEECQNLVCNNSFLQYELEKHKRKVMDIERIKMERDKLEKQNKECSFLQEEIYQTMELNKVLSIEKDELSREMCAKENVIMDQEVEIRKLIRQVDSMSTIFSDGKSYNRMYHALKESKHYSS